MNKRFSEGKPLERGAEKGSTGAGFGWRLLIFDIHAGRGRLAP